MKKLIFLLLAALAYNIVDAQNVRTGVRQKIYVKGYDYKELTADSILRMPRDTLALLAKDSGAMAYVGGKVYTFNGTYWELNTGASSLIEGYGIDITGNIAKLDTAVTNPLYTRYWDSAHLRGNGIDTPFVVRFPNLMRTTPTSFRTIDISKREASFTLFKVIDATRGTIGDFYADTLDTSTPDDTSMTIVGADGIRFKRHIEQHLNLLWFGAKGDNVQDNVAALNAAYRWAVNNNYSGTLYIPNGMYALYSTVEFNFGLGITLNMVGESGSGRGTGAAFVWHGGSGTAMFKFQSMYQTRIENIDFFGRNIETGTGQSAKYLIHLEWASSSLLTLLNFKKCTFGNVGGDSSALINFNATGANTNLQADESTFEDCYFAGNLINSPDSLKSWYAIILGGNNTKNFTLRRNHIINFYDGAVKAFGSVGNLQSERNIVGTSRVHFALTTGTSLLSISDYCESNGRMLEVPGGVNGYGQYTFINYENHSFNASGLLGSAYPVTLANQVTGQGGDLYMQGCTFNAGNGPIHRIDWVTDGGKESAVIVGCKFFGVYSRGMTPFYSSGNPIFTLDRETDYGLGVKHRWRSFMNTGIDSTGVVAFGMPDATSDDIYIRGQVKHTAWVGRPVSGHYQNGDISTNLTKGDGRGQIGSFRCIKAGMFKPLSVNGTVTASSNIITGIASTIGIQVGDIVRTSGGYTDNTYPAYVSAVTATTITLSGRPAEGNGAVTITNAIPVFQAVGPAFGNTAERANIDTLLTVDDKGFIYFNTDSLRAQIWNGTGWTPDFNIVAGTQNMYTNATMKVGFGKTPDYPVDIQFPYLNGSVGVSIAALPGSGLMYPLFVSGAQDNGLYSYFNNNSTAANANSFIAIQTAIGGGNPGVNFLNGSIAWTFGMDAGVDFGLVTSPSGNFATATKGTIMDTTNGGIKYIKSWDLNTTNADTMGLPKLGQILRLLALKQDLLVSGTNIKTINGSPIVGSGDLTVGGSSAVVERVTHGGADTVGNTTTTYFYDPASLPVTSATITMPITPTNGQTVRLHFASSIAALTITTAGGQTFSQSYTPNTISAGQYLEYTYVSAVTGWVASNSNFWLVRTLTTLTDAATVSWDMKYLFAEVTLGGNRTLSVSNAVAGMSYKLIVRQDGTGSRTLALPAGWKVVNGGAGAITLTTTANAYDFIAVEYDGTNYWVSYGRNFN